MRTKISIIVGLVCFCIITCIHPVYPTEQTLQHAGTLLLLLVLGFDVKRNCLSMKAFIGVALFTVLHIIGARYIYSYVPYQEWGQQMLHIDINSFFDTTRNGYDRLVHFSFGLLLMPALTQWTYRKITQNAFKALFVAFSIIQTGSMIYELFEWSISVFMSPEDTENYNGQQGDVWDPQKDMAVAMLGSLITTAIYAVKLKFKK